MSAQPVSRRGFVGWVAAACAVSGAIVFTQRAPVVIRLAPLANQVVRVHTVQQSSVEISADGAGGLPGLTSPIATRVDSRYTMSLGAPDGQGRSEGIVTYGQATFEGTLNGQPLPIASPIEAALGQPFTVVLDAAGKVVDVTASSENASLVPLMKPVLTSAINQPIVLTLAVGESATVPIEAALPMPIPGGGVLNMTSQTTYTLVSIETRALNRIAHLTTTVSSHTKQSTQGPLGAMSLDMTMTGGGAMEVDIDRGIIRTQQQIQTIEIAVQSANPAATGMPPMHVHGTIKTSSTGE